MAEDVQLGGNLITDDRPMAVEQQGEIVVADGAAAFVQSLMLEQMMGLVLAELQKIRIHLETITDQEVKEMDL